MEALLRKAHELRTRVIIPAGVLAQVYCGAASQAPIHRLLHRTGTEVPPLDRVLAEGVGRLCKRSGTNDVVDASVVLAAREVGAAVVTSDPGDLRRLDPMLSIETV